MLFPVDPVVGVAPCNSDIESATKPKILIRQPPSGISSIAAQIVEVIFVIRHSAIAVDPEVKLFARVAAQFKEALREDSGNQAVIAGIDPIEGAIIDRGRPESTG